MLAVQGPFQLTAQHSVVELGRVVRDVNGSVSGWVRCGVTPFVQWHQFAPLPRGGFFPMCHDLSGKGGKVL